MKPFLFGKKPHSAPALHATHHTHSAVPAVGHVTPAPAPNPGPQVELVKEGDKVVRLIVTCTCGERVEVNCLYAAGQ